MNQKLKEILRWVAVLPSAIAGLFIGSIVVNIFSLIQGWFIGFSTNSGYFKILHWVVASLFAGALYVYWGVKVAPYGKKITATILAASIVVLATFNIVLLFIYGSDQNLFWSIVSSISTIIGAGYVMHSFYEKNEDFNLFD